MVRKSGIASTLCATESSTSATSSSEASVSPLTRAAATRAASGRCLRDPSTAQGYIGPVSGSLHGQLGRFLVVGTCTVAVDFVVYRGLLAVSAPVNPAKATSFVVATVLAYVLNRLWTFRAPGGPRRAAAFVVLYATALIVNVGVNGVALRILGDVRWHIVLAFLCAQACSTTLNFVGMRYVVFAPTAPWAGRTATEPPRAPQGAGQRPPA